VKTYTEQFDEWFSEEKKKGLVDIKFFTMPADLKDSTIESFCREALEVLRAKKIPTTAAGF